MNYVSAREGIPVPTKPYERAGRAEWVVCEEPKCTWRGRPGGFHVCANLAEPEPAVAPKPKKKAAPKAQRSHTATSNHCACGAEISRRSKVCRNCFALARSTAECGTVSGYERHRRLSRRDPANNPWPLPESDECGCIAAHMAKRGNSNYGAIKARVKEAAERYLAGENISALAEEFGVSRGGLRSALRDAGVKLRPAGEVNRGRTFPHRRALTPEQVVEVGEAYLSGLSQEQVGEMFDVSEAVICRALRTAGIPARRLGRPRKKAA